MSRILQDKNIPIAQVIRDGNAFTNPMSEHINAFNAKASAIDPDSIATKGNSLLSRLGSLEEIDPVQISNLQTSIGHAAVSFEKYKNHTDQLSGLDLSGEKNFASVFEITRIAQDSLRDCSESESVELNPFNKVFGSILNKDKIASFINEHVESFNSAKEFFDDEDAAFAQLMTDYNNMQDRVDFIRGRIDAIKEGVDQAKAVAETNQTNDEVAYEEAKQEVLTQVMTEQLGGLVGDSCANRVVNMIKTPYLTDAINKVKTKV